MIMKRGVLFLLSMSFAAGVEAVDWPECESELSSVMTVVRASQPVVSAMAPMEEELESLQEEYDNCVQYPEKYDLNKDGCEMLREEYNQKQDVYDTAYSDFNNQLDELNSSVSSLLGKCS